MRTVRQELLVGGIALAGLLVAALGGCPPPAAQQTSAPNPPPKKPPAPGVTEQSTRFGLEGLADAEFDSEVKTIKVGVYLALSGAQATYGQSTRNAIELAGKEINDAGGIGGKQVDLIVKDDRSRKDEAATCVAMLIDHDQVDAVLGEVASSSSLAAAPICQDGGVPMITPSSTNPKVTATGDYIFRVCFTDDFQGRVMAKFCRQYLQAEKAAVLTDLASDYSVGLARIFNESFTELGGEVVMEVSYQADEKDFAPQLTKIAAANPGVLVVPGYYNEAALIAKQAQAQGLKAAICGGDGFDSPKLVEIAGDAAEGLYFANHCWKGDKSAIVRGFYQAYQAVYGTEPDALGSLGYDATYVLAHAFARAGGTDKAAVRDAIAATRNFRGVTGTFSIDENRNARKPAVVLTIKDGKQALAETIEIE